MIQRAQQRFSLGRNFLWLWAGQGLSLLGDNVGGMALQILILQKTGSATALSLGVVASTLPSILAGPVAGVVMDRFSRKTILITCDIWRGLMTFWIGWMIFGGHFSVGTAYIWLCSNSICRAFYAPATLALIPALVDADDLQQANSMQVMSQNISGVAGPAIAGVVLATAGPWAALAADAVSFFVSAFFISQSRPQSEQLPTRHGRIGGNELVEGLRFFGRTPAALRLLFVTMMINLCNVSLSPAMQVHFFKTLAGSATIWGLMLSVQAGAALVSSMVQVSRKQWPNLGRMLSVATTFAGLIVVVVAFQSRAAVIPILYALSGLTPPWVGMPVSTLYQRITPTEIRGRVFTVRTTFSTTLVPIGAVVSGIMLDHFGSRAVVAVTGLLWALTGVAIGMSRPIKQVSAQVS